MILSNLGVYDKDLAHRPIGCEAIMSLIGGKAEVTIDVANKAIGEMTVRP